jgi:uncharacterized protein
MSERSIRQEHMLQFLSKSERPVSGALLAEKLGVTRQIVVHEIALLRALGYAVHATPKGYILQNDPFNHRALLTVNHRPEQTAEELYAFVDCGVKVLDVRVEHLVYGEIVASLYLSSRRDVDHFLHKLETQDAPLLSSLTQGEHSHMVEFQHTDELSDAVKRLRGLGIQVLHD